MKLNVQKSIGGMHFIEVRVFLTVKLNRKIFCWKKIPHDIDA